jgi:hypothetical protein
MKFCFFAFYQQFSQKVRLQQRFTTREGDPSAGVLVKQIVFFYFSGDFFHRHIPARYSKRSGAARCGTKPAVIAYRPVKQPFSVNNSVAILRAHFNTFTTTDTFLQKKHHLRGCLQSFRVMAPLTTQGTALQENAEPQTRAIMYGKFFNVEDFISGCITLMA